MAIDVAVLGATGAVGQRFIQLLEHHPWFQVKEVVASERSSGKPYGEAARWVLDTDIPQNVSERRVLSLDDDLESKIVFSALPASAAEAVEARLASAGHIVCSNARTYRMEDDIPILMPEVNPEQLQLLERQRDERGWKGGIITNSNCTAAPFVMAMAPLRQFRPEKVSIVSMQAVSGAGYPGVASLDIMDNVIPFIGGEEDKLKTESSKMLGTYRNGQVIPLPLTVSAACNRVPVIDSHLICVTVSFLENPELDDILRAWETFSGPDPVPTLPSAPPSPVIVRKESDRPQPRRDRNAGNGMSTVVGRLRREDVLEGFQFIALAHNTIRGAAGCSILNAELAVTEGYVDNVTAGLGVSAPVTA